MSDQTQAIEDVLAGFTPVGPERVPADVAESFQTMATASAERIAARRATTAQAVPAVQVLHGAVIRPGDTLLLAAPAGVNAQQAEVLQNQMRAQLPQIADVIVLSGVTVAGVYREESQP